MFLFAGVGYLFDVFCFSSLDWKVSRFYLGCSHVERLDQRFEGPTRYATKPLRVSANIDSELVLLKSSGLPIFFVGALHRVSIF